ncbi:hypothetical protein JTE90_022710 [Oedothorax gibbosus]|uniref:Transcription termination factor 5, mitochondrial n=1 Tax=Oedothorax gibbosus TaxID=931172 RepID=A0AAV6UNU5_9ARAC|nr:hypothetical protein JTE90_022710 [Oedothorax gibbosus]
MELGFRDVSGRDIFQYQTLLKKSPKDLRKESYNICYNNNLEHFAQFSQEYEFTKTNEVTLKLKKLYEVDSNLQLIKESMNTEYISYKFNCSLFRVQQLFRMYPPLKCQSILITARLLDVLHKDYQMPDSKIFQSPSILSLHNESARSLLQNMPFILGVKTLEIVKKFPLMLRQSSDRVKQVENILKSYNITDEHLLCCPRILAFSPSTVKKRLHYLCNSESFLSMKSQKKFLWLVYHNKNVIPRLDALKAIDRPFSISVFMMTNTNFEKFLKFGSCRQTHNKDTFQYLANVLNLKENEVVLKLQEFPGSQNATIKNCIQVIEYLFRAGVTKKQIFNGLGVIVYDFEVVKFYFEDLPTRSAYQPFSDWTSHYNLIQLLIYAIEVDSGYKGSKVYGPRMKSEYAEKFAACLR